MHILLATPEIAPFSQRGPLAQTSAALPRALQSHKGITSAAVITPLHAHLDPEELSLARRLRTLKVRRGRRKEEVVVYEGYTPERVRVFFLDHPLFRKTDKIYSRRADAARYSMFSRAVVEFCREFPVPVDIIHCMGWASALIPLYLDAFGDDDLADILTVFSLEDLKYQGDFIEEDYKSLALPKALFSPEALELNGRINFSQAGVLFSDFIVTDSPSQARDIQTEALGQGLHEALYERGEDIFGVLPGVDVEDWDPASDDALPVTYDAEHLNGKRRNKSELQHIFGLPQRPMVPLFGFTAPLTRAHGADLLLGALEILLEEGIELQCAVLTDKGEADLMEQAVQLREKHPRQLGLHFGKDEALAHRTLAGVDLLVDLDAGGDGLLRVLRALRYGVVPLVYAGGPVRDVVADWDGQGNAPKNRGAALLLDERDAGALADVMEDTMERYRKPRTWRPMITHGMGLDFSWAQAAQGYVKVFEELLYEEEE